MGDSFMSKRLKSTLSKNSESFYIIEDFTNPQTKKRSTCVYERLGSLKDLKVKYHTDSRDKILSILTDHLNELRLLDAEYKSDVTVILSQSNLIPLNHKRQYNLGYLYPRNILSTLGITNICKAISEHRSFQFNLAKIIMDLVCTRIIYPGSKRSSYEDCHKFFEVPSYQLEDIYRSLPVLAQERYFIESELYKTSKQLFGRDTSILYYDCTNFYFEIEEENDFCKYGKSKENRPNPIVQYGLFTDSDGIPIADITFEGNKNEQSSLRKLEKQIEEDFQFSKFIVCADAGLNGWENKVYNDKKSQGAYIVTQPIKKLKKNLKEWAISPTGWRILGHNEQFDISHLGEDISIDGKKVKTNTIVFYKDRWEKTTKKSEVAGQKKYELEEHIIVSYSTKYKDYQKHIRDKKIERAEKMLENPGKVGTNNPRDPKYYIQEIKTTPLGEVAEDVTYCINQTKVDEDKKYDGFYAVATDLEDEDLSLVIKANKQRWEIEENFEIMKSEFKSRPMYVTTKDAINGHLLICFIALLVYRLLEKKYLKEKYTSAEIIYSLRDLNVTCINGGNYIPSFERTEFIDDLAQLFGFQPSAEVLTQKYINKFLRVANSKKSTKLNQK